MSIQTVLACAAILAVPAALDAAPARAVLSSDVIEATVDQLIARFGAGQAERARVGVRQVAERWWAEDGDEAAFRSFCESQFVVDDAGREALFVRLQEVLELVDGHLHEVRRELLRPQDLDTGPIAPVDLLLGNVDLLSHVDEDLFQTKVAFVALLNFPVRDLADRLAKGATWDRWAWAETRMMDRFALRVPAAVQQGMTQAFNAADQYIAEYTIRMDRLRTADGRQVFPEGLKLISHWGLRDELKAHYSGGAEGLERQRLIAKVMERIVRQEIPQAAVGGGEVFWTPETNAVAPLAGEPAADLGAREPDTRFAKLLGVFRALREADPYAPVTPTYILRKFELERQIPEAEVEALLVDVVASEEVALLAKRIEKRLGRPLEPFDIWFSGFMSRGTLSEADLDARVRAKYPNLQAFQDNLPQILQALGFTSEKAQWLAARIVVDPARGAGHAMGAVRRGDRAHLRTRVPRGGMDYKGYNVALHELGHNTEQVFSLDGIDHWWLNGVPNTAFTEAFAFTFQARDLELLGLPREGTGAEDLATLNDLWMTYEIAGVGLVDMRVWRWLYAHPEATPAELGEAVRAAARDVWNQYYAPHFGAKDVEILAIYSHMIASGLYLPDYALGHIIAFQVADALRKGDFGKEFERMARQGRLTPDAWMRGAVGAPLSAAPLLSAAREALGRVD